VIATAKSIMPKSIMPKSIMPSADCGRRRTPARACA
jgi:hypothetical protein